MDFIYIDDLVTIVRNSIENPKFQEVDCCYKKTNSLWDIAWIINNLSDYEVPVEVERKELAKDYTGKYITGYNQYLEKGLKKGIEEVYKALLNEY